MAENPVAWRAPGCRLTTIHPSSGSGRRLHVAVASHLEFRGRSASMTLTSDQLALIERYYTFYRQLDLGERTPKTELQRQFVEVCRGRKPAVTPHEIAYMEFKRSREKRKSREQRTSEQRTHRLSAKARPSSSMRANPARPAIDRASIHSVDPSAPKPWVRYIDEPLGSREDFKKDSGRNRSRARQPK